MTGALPENWRLVKLGAVLQRRRDTVMPASMPDETVGLVGLEDIEDGGRGGITVRPTPPREIQSLKTQFQTGDILYGKLRPYLNKVGIVAESGLCSTEIWAFTTQSFVLPRFAAAFLASSFFVDRVASQTKGANLPRLDTEAFDAIEIPLPPLSEQQRIVEILQEAEAIRHRRIQAEAKTAELIPAMFSAMFGDVSGPSKRWPVVPVSSFVESFEGGKSLSGVEGDGDTSRPRVLKISAVTSGRLVPDESKALPSSYQPPEEHYVRPGDLLITRANTEELVGATALIGDDVPPNLVLPDKIWRFVWKEGFEGTPEFIWGLFQDRATRKALGGIATGTGGSMKNISMAKLMQMRVAFPPPEKQREFAAVLREMTALAQDHRGSCLAGLLADSVSTHSFSGSLTEKWRAANDAKLAEEIQSRDAALSVSVRGRDTWPGTRSKILHGDSMSPLERAVFRTNVALHGPPINLGEERDLTREQRALLTEIHRLVKAGHFKPYLTAEALAAQMGASPLRRNPQMIETHLALLAARGFLIPVSREEQTADTGEYVFGNAWRLAVTPHNIEREVATGPRTSETSGTGILSERDPGDSIRLSELERLAAKIEKERAMP